MRFLALKRLLLPSVAAVPALAAASNRPAPLSPEADAAYAKAISRTAAAGAVSECSS